MQLLFTTKNDVLFSKISSEAIRRQLWAAGQAASALPAIAETGNRPVHQMSRICNGDQCNLGPVKGAATRSLPGTGRGQGVLLGILLPQDTSSLPLDTAGSIRTPPYFR